MAVAGRPHQELARQSSLRQLGNGLCRDHNHLLRFAIFLIDLCGRDFFEAYLFLIEYLEAAEFVPFEYLTGGLILLGFILMGIGHLIEGNIGAFTKDFRYFIVSPTWIFRFVYRLVGVAF